MKTVDRPLRACAVVVSLIALLAVHGVLIGYRTFANVDEAYAAALAERLLEGHKLYEGAISQRGPLMYYLYALGAKIAGWDNVLGLRIGALLVIVTILALSMRLATKLVSHAVGSVTGLLVAYVFVAGTPPLDGLALHGETLQLPFVLGGALLGFVGVRNKSRPLLFLSGVLFGLAGAIKQSVLLQPIPVVLLLLSSARREQRRLPFADVGLFTLGIILPIALFLVHAALSGTLSALVYYTVTYNFRIHLQPSSSLFDRRTADGLGDSLIRMATFTVALVTMLGAALVYLVRRARGALRAKSAWPLVRGFGSQQYLAAHAVVGCVSALAMRRFFPHYFLPGLPFLAILAASWLVRHAKNRRVTPRGIGAVAGVIVLLYGALLANVYERVDGRVTHTDRVPKIARYIEQTTKPESRIFVWGFSPWFYEYAHRRPAGRYLFETYVTGFVPWFWGGFPLEKSRVVPGSLEALIGDLEREDPEIVVDAGSALIARPMRAYGQAARFLHERYCFEVRVGGYDLYRRKGPSGCRSDAFPVVHPPFDFFDTPLTTGMPITVDADEAAPLCGAEGEPLWFVPPEHAALLARPDAAKEREEHLREGLAYPSELSEKACAGK